MVYVVHHQNLRGPVRAAAVLPKEVRLWILHVFCDRKSCFEQYCNYTFSRRLGWPKFAAFTAAGILSLAMPRLLRGLGAIPVYRGAKEIGRTMELSEAALLRGESLLICPDRDYASNSPRVGEMYRGFLHLEQMYYRKTGNRLAFVPLTCDEGGRRLVVGAPVFFKGDRPFAEESEMVINSLRDRMNAPLEGLSPVHGHC